MNRIAVMMVMTLATAANAADLQGLFAIRAQALQASTLACGTDGYEATAEARAAGYVAKGPACVLAHNLFSKTDQDYQAAKEELAAAAKVRAEEMQREQGREETRRAALPDPRIGMTMKQVVDRTNWGEPDDVNSVTTANGHAEQWVYGTHGHYLYFRNGRLTAIQR
jgi:hypothetical protein